LGLEGRASIIVNVAGSNGSALPHHERHIMAKSPRHYVSDKPKGFSSGHPEGVASIIAPPTKYRAPANERPKTTRGAKLYKRGGTIATRVITRSFTPEVKVVNVRENVWREGL